MTTKNLRKPRRFLPVSTFYFSSLRPSPERDERKTKVQNGRQIQDETVFSKKCVLGKYKNKKHTSELDRWSFEVKMKYKFIYIYIFMTCTFCLIYFYIYIYLERERERSWDKVTTKLHFFDLLKWTAIKAINGSEREILSRLMSWSWKPWCFFQRRYSCYIDTTYI